MLATMLVATSMSTDVYECQFLKMEQKQKRATAAFRPCLCGFQGASVGPQFETRGWTR